MFTSCFFCAPSNMQAMFVFSQSLAFAPTRFSLVWNTLRWLMELGQIKGWAHYKIWQELFSRNGLTFWLEKPTSRQSSASCSVTYLTISATAWVTGTRWIEASRLNCSVMARCCWRFEAMMSITAVSDSPMVKSFGWHGHLSLIENYFL